MQPKGKLILLILTTTLILFLTGAHSRLSLGDEVYHYRFAKDIFEAGKRVAFDSAFESGNPPGYFYYSEPLWHILLAIIWKFTGGASFLLAQFYQSIFYALLVLLTYLLAKELYSQQEAIYSALVVSSIPMIDTFSILFYLDIPATMLSLLCFLLLVKRKFFWSGIVLGLMYLTKRSSFFFLPAFVLITIYREKGGALERLKKILCLLMPALPFIVYDVLWRINNLVSLSINQKGGVEVVTGDFAGIKKRLLLGDWGLRVKEYLNSSLANPHDLIKYFGLVLIILLIVYLALRKFERKDLLLWVPTVSFFIFFCYIFYPASDIRYLLPIAPLLAIIASKTITLPTKRNWAKLLLVFLCFLQFSFAVVYVWQSRQISRGIRDGFAYLKAHTSRDALIIYPEAVIMEVSERRFAWAGNTLTLIENILWNNNEQEMRVLLKAKNVEYIAIKKSRIYDDSKVHHFGGYPKSFVERLPSMAFLKLVFDNKEVSIWKIN